MAVPKFEYFPTRAAFDTARGATTVFNNSVVFIEDTMELFTHGHFWTVSNLSQYYNSSTQKLQLKNGSTVISELDASPFIKDGMLDSVELITTPEGSSAVLSEFVTYNETEYPVIVLDANTFSTITDNGQTLSVIPNVDYPNKAYSIVNSNGKKFVTAIQQYENDAPIIFKFDAIPSFRTNGDNPEYITLFGQSEVNQFVGIYFPYWNQVGDASSIGSSNDFINISEEISVRTESSGSNYPTLPYLKFTFNTFNGEPTHTVIRVSIAELFTVYNGDNVVLSNNYAKAQTYVEPAAGDKVDIAVGKLAKGIADNAAAIATKQATITGAATTITSNNLTASRVLVSDANGKVADSSVTATELGYLSGVTSSIQTQLNSKANIADLGWVEH